MLAIRLLHKNVLFANRMGFGVTVKVQSQFIEIIFIELIATISIFRLIFVLVFDFNVSTPRYVWTYTGFSTN